MKKACVATNRVLVHETVYDEFARMVEKAVKSQIVLGDGFDDQVTHGPLVNDRQLEKVDGLVRDALKKGARIVSGGGIHPTLKGRYFQPTILEDLNPSMEIYSEEIFGPVIPLYKYV